MNQINPICDPLKSFIYEPQIDNSEISVKICSLNVLPPYESLLLKSCYEHSCERRIKWFNPKKCKHKSNAQNINFQQNDWEKREEEIIRMIKPMEIVCLQEVDFTIVGKITEKLTEFSYILPSITALHFSVIFYNQNHFEVQQRELPTHNLPFATAKLKEKITQKIISIYSLHLSGYEETKKLQLTSVLSDMHHHRQSTSITILAGDFNCSTDNETLKSMLKNYTEFETHSEYPKTTNYDQYNDENKKIDHIFFKTKDPKIHQEALFSVAPTYLSSCSDLKKRDQFPFEKCPTDHYPVYGEIKWKKKEN